MSADRATPTRATPTGCESVEGEWGGICPACGERLPNPGPIRSWQGERRRDGYLSGSSAGLGERPIAQANMATPSEASRLALSRGPYQLTPRQTVILAAVEAHGGNRSAAARDLGVSTPAVDFCLRRLATHGVPVPPPSRPRRARIAA